MQIEKDISTGYWIVKQNDLESPIVRAGLANLLYLPAIFFLIFLCVLMVRIDEWLWVVFLIAALWSLKAYDRITSRLIVRSDKIIFVCSFRTVTISNEQVKWIKVSAPLIWHRGDILVIVKSRSKLFFRLFHIKTYSLKYEDREKSLLEIKDILRRWEEKFKVGH
jgi:hypothetical protein